MVRAYDIEPKEKCAMTQLLVAFSSGGVFSEHLHVMILGICM